MSVQGQRYRVTGDVGDRVFFDRDFDGIQDGGETGLAGIAVHLFDPFATLVRSTVTDGSGVYRFQPKPGSYYLQFDLPTVYSFTPQDRGSNDALDSDADVSTGETDTFDVTVLSSNLDWDAGMANGVGDRVWHDVDGDGFQDGGEPGVFGITVRLFTELGGLVAATTTGSDGRYSFPGVTPGVYYIQVVGEGAPFTVQDAAADDRDSDVDAVAGTTTFFTLGMGDMDVTWDAGFLELPTSVIFGDGFESGTTSAWSVAVP